MFVSTCYCCHCQSLLLLYALTIVSRDAAVHKWLNESNVSALSSVNVAAFFVNIKCLSDSWLL